MGWAAAIPIIAAVAGPLMNKMMGGNSGSESTKMQPADWQNQDAEGLYNSVLKIMNDPSFKDRFQTDADWTKAADIGFADRTDQSLEGYLDSLKGVRDVLGTSMGNLDRGFGEYRGSLGSALGGYEGDLGSALDKYRGETGTARGLLDQTLSGTIGGRQIDILPKSNRERSLGISNLADKLFSGETGVAGNLFSGRTGVAGNIWDATEGLEGSRRQNAFDVMGLGQDIFGKTMAQETLRNALLNKNVPNKGFMDWFKFAQDQANKENLARYQLQNTESTAQYNEGIDTAGLLKALTPLFTEGGGQGGGQGTSNFNVNFSDPNYEFPSFT